MSATQHQFPPGTKMNLSLLIDMVLQKAYHELTLLSDLLPRKSDIERKIEIIRFATNARQQFIRLLALVKWAASAEKVDKCQAISTTLDRQNMFFIETADSLARMARETLANARLPNFSLPTAIDVLTTGTFNRLPRCIKEKIVPPDPISASDKKRTIKRLNEVIQNRLAVSKIPLQFKTVNIGEGKVKLTVPHEFEVTLTIMGDSQTIPWRLLKIEFLVNDFDTGDGKPLVHNMQVHYIHQLVQSRIMAENEPLVDLYHCLHYFAISLQLEVLHTQAKRLIGEKWGDLVKVEEYIAGQKLVISYWRAGQNHQQVPSIIIRSGVDSSNLLLNHLPELNETQDIFHRNSCIELSPDCVAMENVLTLASKERSKAELKTLLRSLAKEQFFADNATFNEDRTSIIIQPFEGCSTSELASITIDSRTGKFGVNFDGRVQEVAKKTDYVRLLRANLNEFITAFHNLRCYIYLARYASTVSSLPVQCLFQMAFINNDVLGKIHPARLYIRFNKHPNYILLVDVCVDFEAASRPLKDRFFLVSISSSIKRAKTTSMSESKDKINQSKSEKSVTRKPIFYLPQSITQLNPHAFLQSENDFDDTPSIHPSKRKVSEDSKNTKKLCTTRVPSQTCAKCLENQQRIVAMVSSCNIRIPFITICKEFSRAGVAIQGIQYEANQMPIIRILHLPDPDDYDVQTLRSLRKSLIVCTIRLAKSLLHWNVEYRFAGSPFEHENGRMPRDVNTAFEYQRNDSGLEGQKSLIGQILADWNGISMIYRHALLLRDYIEDDRGDLYEYISIKSFDYKTLSILYGRRKNYTVKVNWNLKNSQFELEFGISGKSPEANPHVLMQKELQEEFNKHYDLPYLLHIIAKTTFPLAAVSKISVAPTLGTTTRPLLALQNISIVTRTSTHLRLFYRNTHVVDVTFLDDKVVVRDGCFTKTDPSKQFGGIGPADHFLSFLQLFDEKPLTGRSKNDSPMNQASMEMDKSHRDGFSHIHGHHDSSSHPLSGSMRSPAFTSPSHSSTGPNSAASYGGQLSSLSPANLYSGSSPGFIQPSPGPAQPAPMTSPVSWPHSPQVSQGSPHTTKQGITPSPATSDQALRSGVASSSYSSPVLLSHQSFARLVLPVEQDFPCRTTKLWSSPLERYFGAVYLAKHLVRVVRKDDTLHLEKYDGLLVFTGSPDAGLQYTVSMNPVSLESLNLNIVPKQGYENYWTADEMRVLKQYFEVVVAPYKVNILTAFARLLGAHPRILKDAIKIMRIEMQPEATQRWLIEWSFMTPPGILASIAAPGTPAVVLKAKNLFFLTDIKDASRRFVFSVLYDTKTNIVQPTEFPQSPQAPVEPPSWAKSAREACNEFLKQIAETIPDKECRLFSSLQALTNKFICH